MSDYFDSPRNKTVRKSNELIQKSRFNLSIQQQKIMLYLISQITPYDEKFKVYDFNITDFCRVCGIEIGGKNYNDLKNHIHKLVSSVIWMKLDDDTETTMRWIDKSTLKYKSGRVQIRLDEDLKPYLLQLRENYTQYDLVFTLTFKCKYTIRLYELIKSIHFDELKPYIKTYTLDELRVLLGAENYIRYNDFFRFALNPAVNEINNNTDKTITFIPIKQGKKVVEIKFEIETKDIVERAEVRAYAEKLLDKQITFFDEGIINE